MLTLDRITNFVSKALGVHKNHILGSLRNREYVAARYLLARLAYDSGHFTEHEIAKYLGKKTSIIQNYIAIFSEWIKKHSDIKDKYKSICAKLHIASIYDVSDKKSNKKSINCTTKSKYHPPICTYTALEEIKIEMAIRSANEFMKKYGQGREPHKIVSNIKSYNQ